MAKQESNAKVTTDHRLIRQWVEARGGHPATVKRTKRGDDPGILRIDYPGYSGEQELEPIDWDEFFDKFEASGLAFVYQDKTADGKLSRFSKLVSRDSVFESESRKRKPAARRSSRSAGTGASAKKTASASSGRGNGEQKTTQARPRTSAAQAPRQPGRRAASKTGRGAGGGKASGKSRPSTRSRSSGAPAPRR